MTKKQELQKLLDYAYNRLCDIGIWVNNYGMPERPSHEFKAQTKGGELHLTLSPDYMSVGKSPTITVFTRFKEYEKAKDHVYGLSKTGKWNHHGLNKDDFDDLFKALQNLKVEDHEVI